MATSAQQQRAQRRAATGAAVAGTAATGVAAAAPPVAAAAGSVTATEATAQILGAFVSFLSALRSQHQAALVRDLGRYSTSSSAIAAAVRAEMVLEQEFARRSADRVASALPQVLRIADPQERAAKLRALLEQEQRYASMRAEAMFARAIAALTRDDLRESSPLGAFWRLGAAQKHTEGCKFMAGHPGRQGRFWPWSVLDRVHPPRHYGCLIGGTRVWGPAVRSTTDRWYEGEILRVTFASGHEVGITPNHPVLQRGGWVAADALRVGDQVVCCSAEELRMRVGDPNEVQVPAAIEDVAGALADAGDVQTVRMPVAAKDFHGDGGEGHVDVVRAGGLLDDWFVIADAQQLSEVTLRSRDRATALLASDSAAGESVVAVRFASFGVVRWLSACEALLSGQLRVAHPGGFASIASYASGAQSAVDGRPGGSEADRELFAGFAGEVSTDEIVGVERHAYRGHVYNLETAEGWYSAGGIVVHNCTSSLHGYGEAILAGWMSPGDVPDERAALRAASGVVMEAEQASALLAELDVRDALRERGIDTSMIALAGAPNLIEAFTEARHPRDWKGRFRTVGDVAKGITDTMIAWQGGSLPSDAPSREQIVSNWTKQVRGRLSKDREALGILKAAQEENAANPRWQAILRGRPADHVVVTHEPDTTRRRTSTLLGSHGEAASRKADTTVINENAVKEVGLRGSEKSPKDHPAATSGYGLAAVLRHEYGHSIDGTLPRDARRHILNAIPDAEHDLTYYAGTGDQEVIPELLATITHPEYRAADWPESVQEAEQRLLAALGVKLPESPAVAAAAALKRGEEATIKPGDAAQLVEELDDGSASAFHKLQVEGHPNLFRAHARELSRGEMPQIPKANLPGFMDFLRSKRVLATVEKVTPSSLQATQNQLNGAGVAEMAKRWDPARQGLMMVSRDGHVLDGHHRWGAMSLYELAHPGYQVDVLRFSVGTDRMLALMHEYNAHAGIERRAFGQKSAAA